MRRLTTPASCLLQDLPSASRCLTLMGSLLQRSYCWSTSLSISSPKPDAIARSTCGWGRVHFHRQTRSYSHLHLLRNAGVWAHWGRDCTRFLIETECSQQKVGTLWCIVPVPTDHIWTLTHGPGRVLTPRLKARKHDFNNRWPGQDNWLWPLARNKCPNHTKCGHLLLYSSRS